VVFFWIRGGILLDAAIYLRSAMKLCFPSKIIIASFSPGFKLIFNDASL